MEELLAHTARHGAGAWNMAVCGGVALAGVVLLITRRARPERRRLVVCFAAGVLGAAAGAAALPVLLRLPGAVAAGSAEALLAGDRMAIGALIGFAAAAAITGKRLGLDGGSTLDRLAAPMGALVLGGRVGCFLEGCDFGAVTAAPWGVRYPAGSFAFEQHVARGLVGASDAAALPVCPAQLGEAAVGAAMIGAALWAERRARGGTEESHGAGGGVFRVVLTVYAVGRIGVEMLRGDERGALGALSLPQWLCVAMLAWCAAGWAGERGQATARSP